MNLQKAQLIQELTATYGVSPSEIKNLNKRPLFTMVEERRLSSALVDGGRAAPKRYVVLGVFAERVAAGGETRVPRRLVKGKTLAVSVLLDPVDGGYRPALPICFGRARCGEAVEVEGRVGSAALKSCAELGIAADELVQVS
jgi:hypothetical protein